MATNPPAKIPDILRFTVGTATEVAVQFPGARTIIGFSIQTVEDVALRVTFTPGGTFSTDNFWTLKSGTIWNERDINWTPEQDAMWVRIPVSPDGDATVEVLYWS